MKQSKLSFSYSYLEKIIPFICLILLVIIISILNSAFLEPSNLFNLLRQVSINGLIAFGMTFVILTGGIDLSVGSTLALSSAVVAILMVTGIDSILALLFGGLFGAILGAINGLLITISKMAPFFSTLATMTVFSVITLVITDGNHVTNIYGSYALQLFCRGYFLGIPVPAV